MRYVDPDGRAYTYKVSNNEYWFSSDLCVLDKAFNDLLGLIPFSSLSKKLSNATSDLNRIESNTTLNISKNVGQDLISSVMDNSDSKVLKFLGKAFNALNLSKTILDVCKDLIDNQTVGREQFIENEFFDVLKGKSRENVESLYLYAKTKVDDFIDCGYINLDIDKKGSLKGYTINNKTAIDMLYNDLKNLQLKLNFGGTDE